MVNPFNHRNKPETHSRTERKWKKNNNNNSNGGSKKKQKNIIWNCRYRNVRAREKKAYFYREWHSQRTTHCTIRAIHASGLPRAKHQLQQQQQQQQQWRRRWQPEEENRMRTAFGESMEQRKIEEVIQMCSKLYAWWRGVISPHSIYKECIFAVIVRYRFIVQCTCAMYDVRIQRLLGSI